MVATVLHQIGFGIKEDEKEIDIKLGVPLYLFQYPEMLKKMQKEISGSVFKIIGDSMETNFKIEKASIHPQAIGAYADLINKNEIKASDRVVIVDIGYRTIDYVVIEKGNIIEEMTGTFTEAGTNYIYKDISNFIESKTKEKLSVEKIESYIKENKEYRKVNLTKIQNAITIKKVEELISELNRKWGENKNTIEKVVLVGGGASLMLEHFNKHFENCLEIENTQLRNAVGYLKL